MIPDYDFYVCLEYPDYPTKNNPAGLYRAYKETKKFQSLNRDGKWRWSNTATEEYGNGEINLVKVSSDFAHQLLMDKDFLKAPEASKKATERLYEVVKE